MCMYMYMYMDGVYIYVYGTGVLRWVHTYTCACVRVRGGTNGKDVSIFYVCSESCGGELVWGDGYKLYRYIDVEELLGLEVLLLV